MIEEKLLNYLARQLEVPVRMEVPEDAPDEFVVIEKTGSGMENYIYTATFAVQSYAPTMYEAAALNEMVKDAMSGLTTLPCVSRSALNSDYNFTDTTEKRYRYQAVFDIVHTEV